MNFNTICVVGLGYIGLPTATMFASRRKKVIGVDVTQSVVDTINRGEIHIVEPDLDIAVRAAVKEGSLHATTRPEPADAFLVAVPTPFKKGQKESDIPTPDLSYIQAAADAIAPVLQKGNLVILESTSPVGTTEQMAEWLAAARPDLSFPQQTQDEADILVAHCPERVLPGRVMQELIENDRIIGGITERCSQAACDLYKTFVKGECLLTNARTAEMTKLTENAFRDVNIAFANELSLISDELKLDVWEVIRLANHHPRVNILTPGPGVGGHCIAVDPWFIVSAAPSASRLIRTAREVNDGKPAHVAGQVVAKAARFVSPTIACLGLAFKANIDDLRESPAVEVVRSIAMALPDVTILAAEPYASDLPISLADLPNVRFARAEDALDEADIVALLVDHDQFRSLNRSLLNGKVVYDTRGIWR